MKVRSGLACLSAAVAAVSILSSSAHAVLQVWDANGSDLPRPADGSGTWDLTTPNWTDTFFSGNNVWVNGNSAIFGNNTNVGGDALNPGGPYTVDLAAAIVVQDLTLGTAAPVSGSTSGVSYSLSDFGNGSLTVLGNITKSSNSGGGVAFATQIGLNNGLTLGAGDHVFALRDAPGDAAPELSINAVISGNANVIQDNEGLRSGATPTGYESWGTLAFNFDNTYTGTTTITSGRLLISANGALGTTGAGTLIENDGTLGLGGSLAQTVSLNVAEPITITRNVYTGGQYGNYHAAVQSDSGAGVTNTLSGPITLNTDNARFRVDRTPTSKLVISSNLVSAGKISNEGAGILELTGNNTGVAGGFQILGGTLAADNQNSIGGASSIITFGSNTATGTNGANNGAGGGYLRINNKFMTDFGTHVVNYTNFSGGLDLPDADQVFNITQNLSGNQIVKRGAGQLNLSGTNTFTGQSYIDQGTMHVTGTQSVGQQFARNGTLLLDGNAVYATTAQYSSFGLVAGENGTLTLRDNATFNAANYDFNISDNGSDQLGGGSKGTLNISGTATLNVAGTLFAGKNDNNEATINVNGGTINVGTASIRRNLELGRSFNDARPTTGTFNMTAGTVNVSQEFFVGNEVGGRAFFNMSGGQITVDSWMSFGRFGADTVADISGGKITKTAAAGGSMYVGERATGVSSMNLHGTGQIELTGGEFWIANDAGTGTVTIADTASLTVNNYLVVGRGNGAKGTLNINGGTITKTGNGAFIIGSGRSTGTATQVAGTVNANTTWIGEGGTAGDNVAVALYDISGGTANFGALEIGRASGTGSAARTSGELRISGTAAVSAGTVLMGGTLNATQGANGTLNINGGSFKADSVAHGIGTGTATFAFNAGKLSVGSYQLAGGLLNTGTGQLSPGLDNAVAANASTTSYTQGATASAKIELASASSFDSLAVTNAANLDGTLNLALLNGYDPASLTAHTILTAGSINGVFSNVQGISLSNTKSLAVTYTATAVNVTATRPGDANVNGTVNFDDLLALAKSYNLQSGGIWAKGDFNGNGVVNFDDLLILAKNYNQSATAADAISSLPSSFQADFALAQSLVPEPTALGLIGMVGLAATRRSRRSR